MERYIPFALSIVEFDQKKTASQQEKEAACEMVGFQDYFALFAAA